MLLNFSLQLSLSSLVTTRIRIESQNLAQPLRLATTAPLASDKLHDQRVPSYQLHLLLLSLLDDVCLLCT